MQPNQALNYPGRSRQLSSKAETSKGSLYEIVNTDAFEWLQTAPMNSIHAVVTDPPYGLVEYSDKELSKLKKGKGGIWRIPPAFDGNKRMPLPRFTVLTAADHKALKDFFYRLASLLRCVLVPGGHTFIATNPLISQIVYESFIKAQFEKRGEIIRTVYTPRGGDRPKNAHGEFFDVTVMPKSCWEPWGLFRKPCEGRVQDNLRKWKAGGLKRISAAEPFKDLIQSSPARKKEREIAPHPSIKPQRFLRQIVRASLPLGEGTILDPFMGSGSTIAAAEACGLKSIGLEIRQEYFTMAESAIPKLAALKVHLTKEDWKYEASTAGSGGGGRTHTFGIKNPATKLKGKAVYQRSDVKLVGGKAVPANGD